MIGYIRSFILTVSLLGVSVHSFGIKSPLGLSNTALSMSTAEMAPAPAKFEQPDRVIRDELPILYVYDHCPFCVRVRVALGVKNIKHNIHFMANDDIATPTNLVGKKIAPIFVSKWIDWSMCSVRPSSILVHSLTRVRSCRVVPTGASGRRLGDGRVYGYCQSR